MNRNQQGEAQRKQPPQGGGPRGGPHGPGFGRPVEKANDAKGTLRRLIKQMRNNVGWLVVVAVVSALSAVFTILSPDMLGNVTNEIFGGFMRGGINYGAIGSLLLQLGAVYALSAACSFITQFAMTSVTQRIVRQTRQLIAQKLTRLPLKYYDSHTHGELMSRVTNDIDTMSQGLQQGVTQAISSVVTIIGILVMMLRISWLMTLITIITLPLSALVVTRVAKLSQKNFKAQQAALGELNGHVEEMLGAHKIVKAYSMEQRNVDKFEGINDRLYNHGWRAQFVSNIIMPMMTFVGNIGYVLACVLGGVLAARGDINIGNIQAFLQYIRSFNQPIQQVASLSATIQSAIASAERVFIVLDEPEEEPDSLAAVEPADAGGAVGFSHVAFGYAEDKPLMKDMCIDVKAGQTIAIVGPTGAGKTTLVNLLMRFYDVSGGSVTVDGVNIRDMKRSSLRGMFGMVLQDTWLFHGTIRENIAYSRDDATLEDVVAAAQAAYADHVIRTLPDGYDTVLTEEASALSQGERQLVTIARAVLADPQILILDEATSSVDTRTERNIQMAMNTLMKGRTSFVIAHRLSTIVGADKILVMNHGDVVEQGTHEELLRQGGVYAELYNSQFSNGSQTASA